MNVGGTSDPYVIVKIQPGSAHSLLKTQVIKKNLNPEFNETFVTMVRAMLVNDFPNVSFRFQKRREYCRDRSVLKYLTGRGL